ncbi:CDP-alcohol phosphatidyltransferase family protein [candidate division WOR-3 bacterium]|nr:CDP-alcohol phosphatidyltransferase family protein [candidate division WOR-3 bacterium]
MNPAEKVERRIPSKQYECPKGLSLKLRELSYLSNLITLSRIAALPFIVIFLVNGSRHTALILMLLLLISDALDGYVARRLGQVSDIGKFLDPVCDKIALAVILITLYAIGSLPLWGFIVIVSRDVLILVGCLVLIKTKAVLYKSNTAGKITGFIFGMIICAFTINLTRIGTILLYVCIPALIVSFTIYLLRYIHAMKGE